jgi:hypothetical protein
MHTLSEADRLDDSNEAEDHELTHRQRSRRAGTRAESFAAILGGEKRLCLRIDDGRLVAVPARELGKLKTAGVGHGERKATESAVTLSRSLTSSSWPRHGGERQDRGAPRRHVRRQAGPGCARLGLGRPFSSPAPPPAQRPRPRPRPLAIRPAHSTQCLLSTTARSS